jgi:ubiquinone biosynthesis protein
VSTAYMTPAGSSLTFDVSPLVPQEYAEFRPLVTDSVLYFLERLPAPRLTQILAAQAALPADVSAEVRLADLIFHCPTLHKLGQVVARDRRLGPAMRRRLQGLESLEPVTPVAAVASRIFDEIGADCVRALRIDAQALAEASVALVIPFTTEESDTHGPVKGVLKVLKPGIEERLEEELVIWSELAELIDARCQEDGLPPLRCREILDTVRQLLSNEVRLDLEQAHLVAAKEFFGDSQKVQIPVVMPCSTPRVTAMERVFGTKVTDAEHLSETARKNLAGTILRELVAKPIWSTRPQAIFHADPHAGNLFYTDDDRLAILDWSLVGHLNSREREQTAQIILAALNLDASRIERAIRTMAVAVPDGAALHEVVDKAVGKLYRTELPGLQWLMKLLGDAMFTAGVQFSADLVLFRKSILTLEGVAADVSSGISLGKVLSLSAGATLLREWARRCVASPLSRDYGTHVSNLDLLSLYFAAPSAATRFLTDRLFLPARNRKKT